MKNLHLSCICTCGTQGTSPDVFVTDDNSILLESWCLTCGESFRVIYLRAFLDQMVSALAVINAQEKEIVDASEQVLAGVEKYTVQ